MTSENTTGSVSTRQSKTRRLVALTAAVAVSGAFALMATTSNVQAQTIDDAMAEAVRAHPAVKAQALEAQAAQKQVNAAQSGYFPTVAFDGAFRRENTERATFDRTMNASEYSLTVSQPLFDGFSTSSRVTAAKSDANAENFTTLGQINDTAFDAAQAFLGVLEARERVKFLKDSQARALAIANRVKKRAQADRGLRSLVVVGNSETEQSHFLVLQAERELKLAQNRYHQLMGQAPGELDVPVEPLDVVTLNEDTALAQAVKAHPALQAVRARAKAADGARTAERASLLPHLSAELMAHNGDNIDGVLGRDNNYYAGLRLTYSFATGGGDIYNYRAASLREQAAQVRIQDIARKVRLDVLDALETYHAARELHSVLMRRRQAATQTVHVYDQQFAGGQRDLLDLFFVLNEEREAYRAELQARYDKLRSAYRLIAAMGELGPKIASE
jgi:adhesin transport system outer membrane protein